MIVLGDISGIQSYLFDVAEEGGGQAQRLRARSFFVQLLAEIAALRVLRTLRWRLDSILLSGAGKFLLRGANAPGTDKAIGDEQQAINQWMLRETRAELRLTLAWAESKSDTEAYRGAVRNLLAAKSQPWRPKQEESWDTSRLLLDPLDTPCSLCGHAPACEDETDTDTGERRLVCRTCAGNRELGRLLPRARWLIIRKSPQNGDRELLGYGFDVLTQENAHFGPETVALANLFDVEKRPSWCPEEKFLQRRLMAHVQADTEGRPVWFTELARRAEGDKLLAVLKADVDSLGLRFQQLLDTGGLEAMANLSERLDAFFAGRSRQELESEDGRWGSIYTIFAGGDDLIMVGPWNVMLDFAGQLHEWFAAEFRSDGLTLSASVALMKPKRPIKGAVKEADRLLELAKSGTKDQLAALGQVWNWQHHDEIMKTARQLVEWVKTGEMERGWLHTLLELADARHGPTPHVLATARLAYHVDRNYRPRTHAREWAIRLVQRFENLEEIDVRYLPAIVRYALTATRTRDEEE
ncbi:MAG: type III-A CRISPR-associated protein Cas10/Csm1 [Gemmataceae bacterium]|nr:type III-A CRISPR-associated protein Cas10/Csm1 [Gemmataceae bacterium]MCI0739524.1 type III-A CRISPR-associated protein Cas10/Csm1 [Gemmataceae bacterium]